MINYSFTPAASEPRLGALTSALFPDHPAHELWRKVISTETFRYREGLTSAERSALTYERLRVLNEEVECAVELARDPRRLATLHEWTAIVDGALATVAGIHYSLFLGSLLDHDDPHLRDLSEFTALSRVGTFLCTERAHGNDAVAMETTATLDPGSGGFVLHTPHPGAVKFMPNTSTTGGPKTAVVAARLLDGTTDHGVFLFLTPLTDGSGPLPGVEIEPLPQRVGSPVDHCATSFRHVRLPRTALLEGDHGRLGSDGVLRSTVGNARKRLLHSIGRVTTGKLCMSAATLGGARAALAITVRYAHHRHISAPAAGKRVPLAAHRSHHGRLLRSVATAYAMTFLHRTVVDRWTAHRPEERTEVERLVAVAKGWITWESRAIAVESRERTGAQGLFPVNGLAQFAADCDGAITAEGDNLAIWCKAAAEMIFGYEPAVPVARPDTPGPEDLGDLLWLRDLLAAHEHLWQDRARHGLRQGPSGDPLGRWNAAVTPALEVVAAHARLQAADAFIAATAATEEAATRAVLADLCRLFLLNELNPRSGDLLAHGHMTAAQVRQLPLETDRLTGLLAPHLSVLAEAFDVPAEHFADLPLLGPGPEVAAMP